MTLVRLAAASLWARPVRSVVLACGFGFGIAVMAALLGVGSVMLEQATAPALQGGGDVVVTGVSGQVSSARLIMKMLATPGVGANGPRARAVSPSSAERLYLISGKTVVPVLARGGVPSLEKAVADPETSPLTGWTDAPADRAWTAPDPGDLLRAADRFHAIPETRRGASERASWAEWLYFNGRTADGAARFYLTFLVGPETRPGRRLAGVRLQLDRGRGEETFAEAAEVSEAEVLAGAPDLAIGASRVRLAGARYEIALDLARRGGEGRARGEIALEAPEGGTLPPFVLRGAGGWISGYVVPVLSGPLNGSLNVDDAPVSFRGGTGYHDHNWGFWEGVTWQWGQVAHGDLSIVFGRIRPPADAADPDLVPGFLAVLGPTGPAGFSSDLTIEESRAPRSPEVPALSGDRRVDRPRDETSGPKPPASISVRARGARLDLRMALTIESVVRNPLPASPLPGAAPFSSASESRTFFQLKARYRVTGTIGDQAIDFTSLGSAETFRGE